MSNFIVTVKYYSASYTAYFYITMFRHYYSIKCKHTRPHFLKLHDDIAHLMPALMLSRLYQFQFDTTIISSFI